MVHYYLKLEDTQTMANELDDLSACVQTSDAMISDICNFSDHLLVEVISLDFNTVAEKFENNVENVYNSIACGLQYGLSPVGVKQEVLDFMVAKIPVIKKDISLLDDACLNAGSPELMEALNERYLAQSKLLNLVYQLSSTNLYIFPDTEV